MAKALAQVNKHVQADYAKGKVLAAIVRPLPRVLHKTPDDEGMTEWRDIYFPSNIATPLEDWYIPATSGERGTLLIFNHTRPICRAGFQGHFDALWNKYDAVEIDVVVQMNHLSDEEQPAVCPYSGRSRLSQRPYYPGFHDLPSVETPKIKVQLVELQRERNA